MSEYTEMRVVSGPDFIIDVAPPSFLLRDGRDEWLTEWHPWFGPNVLSKKTLDPLANQPGEKSRFWLVAQWWKDQGAKVVDGVAQWKEPEIVALYGLVVGRNVVEISRVPGTKEDGRTLIGHFYNGVLGDRVKKRKGAAQ